MFDHEAILTAIREGCDTFSKLKTRLLVPDEADRALDRALQKLRRLGQIAFDAKTRRWETTGN